MEALLVLVITLIVVGPQRFPEIARQGGRWYRVARRFTAGVMSDVREAVDEIERDVNLDEDLRSVRELGDIEDDVREAGRDINRAAGEAAESADERPQGAATRTEASQRATSSATSRSASDRTRTGGETRGTRGDNGTSR